jgi:hypothetical protein
MRTELLRKQNTASEEWMLSDTREREIAAARNVDK